MVIMKGVYVLIIHIPESQQLAIKSLGQLSLENGTWLYVGSAVGNGSTSLENRLKRHFRRQKVIHWHIDYLLNKRATVQSAVWAEGPSSFECEIAQALQNDKMFVPGPKGFGASDCKNKCISHIFRYLQDNLSLEKVQSIFIDLGLQPRTTYNDVTPDRIP
jgi:Uri superfamily endonuclease